MDENTSLRNGTYGFQDGNRKIYSNLPLAYLKDWLNRLENIHQQEPFLEPDKNLVVVNLDRHHLEHIVQNLFPDLAHNPPRQKNSHRYPHHTADSFVDVWETQGLSLYNKKELSLECLEQLAAYEKILKQFSLTSPEITPGKSVTGEGGTATQIDSSFLTSVMGLAERNSNLQNTKDLVNKLSKTNDQIAEVNSNLTKYQDMLKNYSEATTPNKRIEQDVEQEYAHTLDQFYKNVEMLRMFYNKLSEYSINPQSQYYTTNYFTSITENSYVSHKKANTIALVFWVLAEGILLLFILIKSKIEDEKKNIIP